MASKRLRNAHFECMIYRRFIEFDEKQDFSKWVSTEI